MPILYAELDDTIAYHYTAGHMPCVVFLPGFRSDMQGNKALAIEHWCKQQGRACLRLDYFAHGDSPGDFYEGTIGRWAGNVVALVRHLQLPQVVFAGSSMGGWLMLLAAQALMQHGTTTTGLLGIAPAPDFTEDLLPARASAAQHTDWQERGVTYITSAYDDTSYPITRTLLEEGRKHLCLRTPIALNCPIRLVHGMQDTDVPYMRSLDLLNAYQGDDAQVHLIKDAGHRLSRAQDMAVILQQLGLVLSPSASPL